MVGHSPEQIFHPGKPGSWDDGGVGGAVVSLLIERNAVWDPFVKTVSVLTEEMSSVLLYHAPGFLSIV